MPNFDGGHYFLTTLAPVRTGTVPGESISYVQRLRLALQDLPTANQSPATVDQEVESPFARSLHTHLCRFVIIDDTIYGGPEGPNPLLVSAQILDDPILPRPVDQLPCPYLMFAVDFDAVRAAGEPLPDTLTEAEQDAIRDHYLQQLWQVAGAELGTIYENCQGFDEACIQTPEDFAGYLARCQIETWMSFNDYYLAMPDLPELPINTFKLALGLPAAGSLLFGLLWLLGADTFWPAALLALVTAGIAYWIYRHIVDNGRKAWPAAEYGDLPSVLKGLYLQQRFADFVVETQGADPEQLQAAFGRFLKETRPRDVLENTQPPGVIRS